MGNHLINGEFQSDKYPTTPIGKVPLSCKDKTAQDLLWEYAQRRRAVDAEFSDDLEQALKNAGYVPRYRNEVAEVCGHCGLPASGEMTHRLHEQEGCLPISARIHVECSRCDGTLCQHHRDTFDRQRAHIRKLEATWKSYTVTVHGCSCGDTMFAAPTIAEVLAWLVEPEQSNPDDVVCGDVEVQEWSYEDGKIVASEVPWERLVVREEKSIPKLGAPSHVSPITIDTYRWKTAAELE